MNFTYRTPADHQTAGGASSERLRVLVVSQHFWPESFRINEVVESLRSEGCDVEVLAGQPNYPQGRIFEGYSAFGLGTEMHPSGYLIHRVPVVPRGDGGGTRRIWNYFSFVILGGLLGPYLTRSKQYDVVFVYAISPILQGLVGAVFRRIKGAAHVIWVQDLWPESLEETGFVKNRWALAAVARLTGFIYRRADLLLAQSRGFIGKIQAISGDDVPIAYHPNPGDRSLVESATYEGSSLKLPAGFNVVFAGNLGTAQALETVLDAASRIQDPEIRVVLVGSGSRSEWLRKQIERRRLTNVMLAGRFPSEMMPSIFAQSSALLVTLNRSAALGLTIPSKIPTYLAAGRPILACLDGEAAEIIRDANAGITIPAEDSIGLAEAMVRLKNMPQQARECMATAGQEYFNSHFAPSPLARELIAHFRHARSNQARSRW
ncbi:glycosyltransferase family 4 protein [Mesorhizobium sp.]|uniref:glycosyltransferase family 4 protein n=1 Tax=Mesorhizobium sp. TaxID=1871066 RepID=UPI000FE4EA00|nr:glycosyltransferase family 4 protein [Mesorhizobium sp.]RWM29472.1 MAG: glycosyltransferase WbuB [Mesorhizobium sp.]RWM42393.1 MAG: glycosyltransferase WbuB [Mesorhizobium sp.]TJV52852.1 MAG: glycosyltransferase family 4 protein [Mesorhizobium sp.]